jgi:hypothetical protein
VVLLLCICGAFFNEIFAVISSKPAIAMEAVMLTIKGPDPQLKKKQSNPTSSTTENGTTTIGTSGILIRESNLIVTHLTPVLPFLDVDHQKALYRVQFQATIDGSDAIVRCELELDQIFYIEGLLSAVDRITRADPSNWIVGYSEESIPRQYLAGIAVLRVVSHDLRSRSSNDCFTYPQPYSRLKKGQDIQLIGTPFGVQSPNMFLNTVCHGVVCNLVQSDHEDLVLGMTDAKCLPGMEGSAVIDVKSRECIGVRESCLLTLTKL